MKRLALAFAAQGVGFWLAISVVPPQFGTLAVFAGTLASAYLLASAPVQPLRDRTASIVLERLFWVTGHDRIRTRDSRVLWLDQ